MSPPVSQILHSFLTSAAAADESQVIEFRHLVLHDSRAVPQLRTVILVVTSTHGDHSTIAHVTEGYYFEGYRQRLVGAPMRR